MFVCEFRMLQITSALSNEFREKQTNSLKKEYLCNLNRISIMREKDFSRIKVVLIDKNLQCKWLAGELGRD